MNRLQAAKELRNNHEGLSIMFEGLEARFEVHPLWIKSYVEYDNYSERPKKVHPDRFFVLFRQEWAAKPNGLVKATWKQILGLLRRNYSR